MRVEFELRNVPRFRVRQYLTEAGGTQTGELTVKGIGWSAELIELEPVIITKIIEIPRDLLVIEGTDEAEFERVTTFMRRKTMRGGG